MGTEVTWKSCNHPSLLLPHLPSPHDHSPALCPKFCLMLSNCGTEEDSGESLDSKEIKTVSPKGNQS